MKRVFILGAGASADLRFDAFRLDNVSGISHKPYKLDGPVADAFFYHVRQCSQIMKELHIMPYDDRIQDQSLVQYIRDYFYRKTHRNIEIEELFVDKCKSRRVNIEALYSEIKDKHNVYLCSSLARYIHNVFAAISYYCFSILHRVLAHYLLDYGGDVISFNWDILLEEELFATGKWDYYDGYGFVPKGIIDKNKGKYSYENREKIASSNLVLKPHGSINWYRDELKEMEEITENDIYIGIPLTRKNAFRSGGTYRKGQLQYRECVFRKKKCYKSIFLPPGKKRRYNKFIWERMKELLEKADEIIAIGYSFNKYDEHAEKFFSELKYKKQCKVIIINKDSKLEIRYKEIFPEGTVLRKWDSFYDYCKWIVSQDGMKRYSSLFTKQG